MIKLSKVVKAIGNVGKTGLRKEKKEKKYQNPVKQNRQKREIREMGKVEIYYPRYNERKISDAQYKKLRDRTPSKEMRDKVNENVEYLWMIMLYQKNDN